MDLSDEYLYDGFKKNYDEALYFKKVGNLKFAKQRFYAAADFLERLALTGPASAREERMDRASRIKAVADAITYNEEEYASAAFGSRRAQTDNTRAGTEEQDSSEGDSTGMEQFLTFYSPDELQGFDSVIGLEKAKKAVTQYVINPALHPEYYNYNFLDNKAILLEGPPGTGKTTFAMAVAAEIKQPFAIINMASLINCYVGETGKNIDRVFNYLRAYVKEHNCGITVFFDELDEIAKNRGGDDKASETAVPALLRNLDGVKKNKAFLILANTNRKDVLDKGVLERFRQLIYIPLPDEDDRVLLFREKLKEVEPEFLEKLDFGELGRISEGLSGRSITIVCDDFKYYLSELKSGQADEDDVMEKMRGLVAVRITQTGT